MSPDGRALFFLRGELMWVDAGVIEEIRAKALGRAPAPKAPPRSR